MAWTAGAAVVPVLREEMDDIAGMRDKMARLGRHRRDYDAHPIFAFSDRRSFPACAS